jgi:hypothetical protein
MKFLSALAAQTQQCMRRFIVCASLALAAALTGAIGLGFATYALFRALQLQYGAVNAAIALAAIYLVVAGLFALLARGAGRPAHADPGPPLRAAGAPAAPLSAAPPGNGAAQDAAIAMGVELAKQLTPLQLALLAVLSGFVAGRRL